MSTLREVLSLAMAASMRTTPLSVNSADTGINPKLIINATDAASTMTKCTVYLTATPSDCRLQTGLKVQVYSTSEKLGLQHGSDNGTVCTVETLSRSLGLRPIRLFADRSLITGVVLASSAALRCLTLFWYPWTPLRQFY